MQEKREYDLSERLLRFASMIIATTNKLPNTLPGRRVGDQLFKAGTSAGANYEEAVGAESKRDFVHKLGIAFKELRESRYWLKLICKTRMLSGAEIQETLNECDQLIRIIAKSIHTAKSIRGAYGNLADEVRKLEIGMIQTALEKTRGNRSEAARSLGLSREGLRKKIERYSINK